MNYNPTIDIKAKVGRPTNIKLHQNIESLLVDNKSRTNRGAEGIGGRVKFLPLAWAGMPKTSFRKKSDSPLICGLFFFLNNESKKIPEK
jgi:hypothetical protein